MAWQLLVFKLVFFGCDLWLRVTEQTNNSLDLLRYHTMESLGQFLRKERETRNISLEEVSRFTKIKQHHLKAIEEGKPDLLPPTPYVKGYLNIYAKYLTLDPKTIVLRYEEYLKSLIPPESIELQHQALQKKKSTRPWYSLSFIFS